MGTPDVVDSLARICADATLKAGKAADIGSLTKQQWTKVVSDLNREAKTNLSKRQIHFQRRVRIYAGQTINLPHQASMNTTTAYPATPLLVLALPLLALPPPSHYQLLYLLSISCPHICEPD